MSTKQALIALTEYRNEHTRLLKQARKEGNFEQAKAEQEELDRLTRAMDEYDRRRRK